MRMFFAIILCKLCRFLCHLIGKGSSFPGQLALKICPDLLKRIRLPENVIAVTGSNGKTSTVEMIHEILVRGGYSVAYNSEGSNQIEGVATLVACNSSVFGKYRKDVLLMEVDERYVKYVFQFITPKYLVINNLYRDQMTRNGHPEFVLNEIKKGITEGTILVINADDPLISSLAVSFTNPIVYYGVDDNQYVKESCDALYDDGYYCPVCKQKMIYDYRQFAHVGKYHCLSCGFKRKDPSYTITSLDLEEGNIIINKTSRLHLALNTIYNAYNMLAAYTVASLLKVDENVISETLNDYLIRNGRIRKFRLNDKEGTLLISKHENSISYNRNIEYIAKLNRRTTLLLIVDDISRKYFTSDTSWLWDISFEMLNTDNIAQVVVAGKYIHDVAVRLTYAGISRYKIITYRQTADAVEYLKDNCRGELYALTCFADEQKLLKEVEVL